MAKVIIFGFRDIASLAHFYLKHDSPHEVVAFSAHREYLPAGGTFEGLPAVPFEEVESAYPPAAYSFFAPMSHRKMNRLRAQVYGAIKAKGYSLISYVSSRAMVWMPQLIGENCLIVQGNTIQPFTSIGNNVMLWSGNCIGHHVQIGDHVYFGPHVALAGRCRVGPYCFFGANATIRNGLNIAEGSCIAMAAAVIADTEPWGVYKGNPARKSGCACTDLKF